MIQAMQIFTLDFKAQFEFDAFQCQVLMLFVMPFLFHSIAILIMT